MGQNELTSMSNRLDFPHKAGLHRTRILVTPARDARRPKVAVTAEKEKQTSSRKVQAGEKQDQPEVEVGHKPWWWNTLFALASNGRRSAPAAEAPPITLHPVSPPAMRGRYVYRGGRGVGFVRRPEPVLSAVGVDAPGEFYQLLAIYRLSLYESQRPVSTVKQIMSRPIGDRRTHSDTLDNDDDGLVDLDDELRSLPEPRTTASGNRAKPALKDQDTSAQEYLKHMIGTRNYTSVVNAFPDAMTVIDVIAEQKEKAEDALGGHFGITPATVQASACFLFSFQTHHLQVAGRISHLRGEGKTKIAPIVEATWFETGLNAKIVSRNRKMAQTLKENSGFSYLDPENRKGLYKNPVLRKAVNTLWFANRRDEGPSFPELYKPLPIPALALILTLIENCVDEWLTGIKTLTPFTANEYRTVYESHIMSLKAFGKHTARYAILDNLRIRLYNIGRCLPFRRQPIETQTVCRLTTSDMDAAIKEYEDADQTESDGEDGQRD
ncbi:hypothetical protein C8F01DRAFT_1085044 [Mycena amicta]|nr:hypothetical protein C8F01DRAFT_1085044 [Mycena amicta]